MNPRAFELGVQVFTPDEVQARKFDEVKVTYHVQDGEWALVDEYAALEEVFYHRWIIIHAGFRFDLASVPRALWWAVAPFELSLVAPLVHDFLYRGNMFGVYTRAQADKIFEQFMKEEGVGWVRRKAAYAAVRLVGGKHWKGS